MSKSNPDKLWLVGGGLMEPWSYRHFWAALSGSPSTASRSVAEILLKISGAIYAGAEIVVNEIAGTGEGCGPQALPAVGECICAPQPSSAIFQNQQTRITLKTSGTSGAPKTVTHRLNTLVRGISMADRHREDVWGLAYNPTHIAGLHVYLQALANLNSMVNLWGLPEDEIIWRCRHWGVTHIAATPTFYRLLLARNQPLPSLRSISIGGEPPDEAFLERLRLRFPQARIRNIYASTEAGSLFSGGGLDLIVPDQRAHLVRIEDGRLWIHSSLLAESARNAKWYDTGDLVTVTGKCPLRIRIVGRISGWINVGGEKVCPEEIESVLRGHEGIADARVFGRENSVTGSLLAAELKVVKNGLSEAAIRKYLAQRLPPHKIPRLLKFVDEIELTSTGKIRRQ